MVIEISLFLSIISVAFSIFFGLKNNKRTDVKDIEERVEANTRINIKLDNICQTVQDIKTDMSSMRNDLSIHNDRIIKVEESCKQAHHRLDEMAERINGGHNE